MASRPELEDVLTQLIVLTSGQPHISEYLLQLRTACSGEPSKLQAMVSDLRLWGGMGSVADQAGVDLLPEGQQRTQQLLVRLYELLAERGIQDDRGESWIAAFRQWSGDAHGAGRS